MRWGLLVALALAACGEPRAESQPAPADRVDERAEERAAMVRDQLQARDVRDPRVLEAMRRVPRHRFVPEAQRGAAYEDHPLPIGHDQTISQPYIVGLMSQLAQVRPGQRVLEVGTGSGYQAAALAELGAEVYTIEIVAPLGERARATLQELGYDRVHVRIGDGYAGWPERAPFDAVVVTAAPREIPQPLLEQLRIGGRLVAPVGAELQDLIVVTRTDSGYSRRSVAPVLFVPMTGRAQER